MIRSSFFGLNLGYKGVAAQQRALDVTGHNIANANTEGYSRQRAVMVTGLPMYTPNGYIGSGVEIINVERVRDKFLDQQFRNESNNKGYWDTTHDVYSKIEAILNEPVDSSMRSSMDQFWAAWQDLSKEPESAAIRTTVVQRGITMTDNFNHLDNQLALLKEDLGYSIQNKVDEINSIANRIASLNLQIIRSEADGKMANDFRDRRDLLVEQLSKIVDIEISEDNRGSANIFVRGRALVFTNHVNNIETVPRADGMFDVKWNNGAQFEVKGGELKALLNARDTTINGYMEKMDEIARTLAELTNAAHESGFGLNGPNDTGNPFFVIRGEESGALSTGEGSRSWPAPPAINGVAPIITAQKKGDELNDLTFVFSNKAEIIGTTIADPTALDFDGTPLTFSVNGKTISLTRDNYADIDDLRADIETKFIAEGINVTVGTDGNQLVFSSSEKIIISDVTSGDLADIGLAEQNTAWDPLTNTITITADWANSELTEADIQRMLNSELAAQGFATQVYLNMRGAKSSDIANNTSITLDGGSAPSEIFTAKNIEVNADLIRDITKIAAAKSPVTDPGNGLGDGSNAVKLAQIKYNNRALNEASIDDNYRSMIGDIGINAAKSESMARNQELLVRQISTQREYVMGVSLDEEMTNMIMFQQAYNASARFLTTVDDMLDVLVNRLGRVGL